MKKFCLYILLFLISQHAEVWGCGFYPYGDEVRWTLLDPRCFQFRDLGNFHYSCGEFLPLERDSVKLTESERQNIEFWLKRCHNKITSAQVKEVLYEGALENGFTKYLLRAKDVAAIDYLRALRTSDFLNTFLEDPWERNDYATLPQRTELINSFQEKAEHLADKELALRYAFLAVRLAYYNHQPAVLKSIYQRHFSPRSDKQIIDYWALHFYTLAEDPGALRNFHAAQVFLNASDKRFSISFHYETSVPLSDVLKFASTPREKIAVYFLSAIKNPGRCLREIRELSQLEPGSEELRFVVLRELNKLEDWIYTPYYKHFEPSLELLPDADFDSRITRDRAYAGELLEVLESPGQKNDAQYIYQLAKTYLGFMAGRYKTTLDECEKIRSQKNLNPEQDVFIGRLHLLAQVLTAENPRIPDEAARLLMSGGSFAYSHFLFAMARELEFRGNKTEAALLFSRVNNGQADIVYWKNKRNIASVYMDLYDSYFYYLDSEYEPAEIQKLIDHCEAKKNVSAFDWWLYAQVDQDIPLLYDLLGTKYMRENKLEPALTAFKKVPDRFWESSSISYTQYLDANPFYTNSYNEHTKTIADTVRYNKRQITELLIDHLKKAGDTKRKDRDFEYFLAANCYLNMSYYGNSWMMKRYYWSASPQKSGLPDDEEYMTCALARDFYLKASELSGNKKFKALSLRMAGRCEKYRLMFAEDLYTDPTEEEAMKNLFRKNVYYQMLKKTHPEYYEELVSNCEAFTKYFEARRREI